MYIKHTKTLRLNDIGETPVRSQKNKKNSNV